MNRAVAYRPDIDGMRCVAVSSVVLFHAVPSIAPGGFVGVDIFFVISGYLIGGIIFREVGEGRFSFANFYSGRARRILPALLATITATFTAGLFLLSTQEAVMLAGSAIWSIVGVSNVFFWRHIDYFAPDATVHPLLMTWSLGVEEQFYLFAPIVLIALTRFLKGWVISALVAICVLSFAISLFQSFFYPLVAFYLLPSRVWELGVGVALAIWHASRGEGATGIASNSNALAAGGLALALCAIIFGSEEMAFPGFLALAPVLGTLAIIQTRNSWLNRMLLGSRLFVGIGLVSYSWYLWHWPMLTYVRISANGTQTDAAMIVTALLSLGIAYLSWRYVEQPFRRPSGSSLSTLARYGCVVALSLAFLQGARMAQVFPQRLPPQVPQIEQQLQSVSSCMSPFGSRDLPDEPECYPSDATVALIGDSHATAFSEGLIEHVEARRESAAILTKPSCSPLLGYGRTSPLSASAVTDCLSFNDNALGAIAENPRIETVILAGFWPLAGEDKVRRREGDVIVRAEALGALHAGLLAMVDEVLALDRNVVIVQDVPFFEEDAGRYVLAQTIPARQFLGSISSTASVQTRPQLQDTSASRAIVAQVAQERPQVTLIDPYAQLCSETGCRVEASGIPLFRDGQHLSSSGSRMIRWDQIGL